MEQPHAKFGQAAQVGHFFTHDLAGADEGGRLGAVGFQHGFHTVAKDLHGGFPVRRFAVNQRGCGTVGGVQHSQGLPALGAGGAQVDRVVRVGGGVDGHTIAQVQFQPAACGAEAADGFGRAVGLQPARQLAEPKAGGIAHKVFRERTAPFAKRGGGEGEHGLALLKDQLPGIFGPAAAVKKYNLSMSWLVKSKSREAVVIHAAEAPPPIKAGSTRAATTSRMPRSST